ncbi:hypothetical protein [Streptomyces subrutilus]|uniref:Uncharacterized protein n=1 Tax=Streptomyces subrutilus TaxID=36818 RepID=A0A5P2UNF2_9ACTN|nr:hypothetical protein [Streptomyces subrutilus]QEU80856.1 hypothetical protein CP968_23530 [Streptomyces subrutilus]WSJ29849.1 hypothetical protein OG479_11320 [Streptomyces subrutilus]GGZ97589.1 hypothetical protein GCM10010371_66760 [Streptomyces subrutilus]
MGGREHTRAGRHVRPSPRRALLLTALGLLVGTLFLCGRPATAHESGPGSGAGSGPASSAQAHPEDAPAQAHPDASAQAHARGRAGAPGSVRAVCVSPYDLPGCSPLAHGVPVVLPVPPPPVVLPAGAPPAGAAVAGAKPLRPALPRVRAPDPYALQVLRT